MGQVAAVIEAEAEDGVAGVEQTEIDGHVGAGATVRLDIGMLRAEQLLGTGDGDRFDIVDDRVAEAVDLGLLVGRPRRLPGRPRPGGRRLHGGQPTSRRSAGLPGSIRRGAVRVADRTP